MIALVILVSIVASILHMPTGHGIDLYMSVIAAYTVGQIYTAKTGEIIPKENKIKAIIYFVFFQIFVCLAIIWAFKVTKGLDTLAWVLFFTLTIDSFLMYFAYKLGERTALKKINKE